MSELSITQTDIKKSLDILTLQENGNIGNIEENIFNPIAIGFGTLGAAHAIRNNSGVYLSRCSDKAAQRSLSKLMEIDNAYLTKMCTSKDIAIATRAQLLKGQIELAKRSGMTAEIAENCLDEFNTLSKSYHKGLSGKVAAKAPGVHRAWKAQGGKAMLAFGLAVELLNIVLAFQESAQAGVKQTTKSIAKTALNTGGWVAGAAAGAIIGSFIPGAGTVIGGAIGAIATFLGGSLGMFGADKLSEVTGLTKSESLTINNNKQSKENEQTAAAIASGDNSALLAFTEQLNSWAAENVLDENGKAKKDIPKDVQKKYEQLMKTAEGLGIVA